MTTEAKTRAARWAVAVALLAAPALAIAIDPPPIITGTEPPREESPATKPAKLAVGPATQPDAASNLLPWFAKLGEGMDDAERRGQLIVVDVGADWCSWCKLLDKEIARPEVQAKLAGWSRVRLDLDKDADAVRGLTVGAVPALRALTPNGRVVASHNGYLKGEALLKWLDAAAQKHAGGKPPANLAGEGPADEATVEELVKHLAGADAVVREAATRRLLARPDLAAVRVVDAFAKGGLAAKLATLELLTDWKAPVAEIDPWEPATVTPDRLSKLRQWAQDATKANSVTGPAARPTVLSAEQLADARKQIAALLQSATDAEATSARERLARLGPALLPEVYAQLKNAADRDRQRFTALRYRLAASDALARSWPGGFDRLASADAQTRHQALAELGPKATSADGALLLELFSDPDPLLRESSLKLLKDLGGQGTTTGLVKLLGDPEPNVRAAVLKQLAESPVPGMDVEVVKYVAGEKDADLVVHAVRVLREAKSKPAADSLLSLLAHESWRVRAEAAEALGKVVTDSGWSAVANDARKADVYAAMIRLLDEDPDGFVMAKCVAVLRGSRTNAAREAMVKAANKRPEMAAEVVRTLAREGATAAGELRKFLTYNDASVRAAAVTALAQVAAAGIEQEVLAALQDKAGNVRVAGAEAMLKALEARRPNPENQPPSRNIFGFQKPKADPEAWLAEFRSGKDRPQWMIDCIGPLEVMLASEAADERLAAAVPLIALGRDEKAAALLKAGLSTKPPRADAIARATAALPWLPWAERLKWFGQLAPLVDRDSLGKLAAQMTVITNPAAADPLWNLLANPNADAALTSSVTQSLRQLYLGDRYYDTSSLTEEKVKPLVEACKPKAAEGAEMQRVAALALLMGASPEEAAGVAEKLMKERRDGDALKLDGFKVLLLSRAAAQSDPVAVAALSGADWEVRKTAVRYLAMGPDSIGQLRDAVQLYSPFVHRGRTYVSGEPAPVVIEPPKGLTAEPLRPMLKDTDLQSATCAAYLLALLGDRPALDMLVAHWRQHKDDEQWRSLTYKAITAANDDALTTILEEMYGGWDKTDRWDLRDFYWTIRNIKGEKVLKLRKQIRDEVGMENLR